jgi:Reverse transcriptase (RNA-dependent DNA polymerase).
LYDQDQGRVLYSRDVIFDELKNGFKSGTAGGSDLTVGSNDLVDPDMFVDWIEVDAHESDQGEGDKQYADPTPRPQRVRRPPQRLGEWICSSRHEESDPVTMREALGRNDSEHWKVAMREELESLHDNDVWDLVDKPKNRHVIDTRWVFKIKRDEDGNPERYKARLVARGFTQQYGLDYDETFCPVVRFETVRALLALSAAQGLSLHQMDIKTAFLNGEIKEEIFVNQPEGNKARGKENMVCRLKKGLYGLKQSPRVWNSMLDSVLKDLGFVQTKKIPVSIVQKEKTRSTLQCMWMT